MFKTSSQRLIVALALFVSACAPGTGKNKELPLKSTPNEITEDNKKTQKPQGDAIEQADALLDEGEALLNPDNLSPSQDKFHAALALAPELPRARFWGAMVDFLSEAHGMIGGVRPFYQTFDGGEARYDQMTEPYRQTSDFSLSRFMMSGPQDIHNVEEYSDFVDRLRLKTAIARRTLGAIRDSEFTITIPENFAGTKISDHKCTGFTFGPIKFQQADGLCSTSIVGQVGLNTSDFDQLAMTMTGMQIELELFTAYRVNPTVLFAQLGKPNRTKKDAEAFMTKLFTGADGSLTRAKPFIDAKEIGAQAVLALRFQQEHQATECPKGVPNAGNRKGYLFSNGNCIELSVDTGVRQRTLEAASALASGRPVTSNDGSSIIDYNELANHPPQNIKELFPLRFDDCAEIVDMKTERFPKIFNFINKARVFSDAECKAKHPGVAN